MSDSHYSDHEQTKRDLVTGVPVTRPVHMSELCPVCACPWDQHPAARLALHRPGGVPVTDTDDLQAILADPKRLAETVDQLVDRLRGQYREIDERTVRALAAQLAAARAELQKVIDIADTPYDQRPEFESTDEDVVVLAPTAIARWRAMLAGSTEPTGPEHPVAWARWNRERRLAGSTEPAPPAHRDDCFEWIASTGGCDCSTEPAPPADTGPKCPVCDRPLIDGFICLGEHHDVADKEKS